MKGKVYKDAAKQIRAKEQREKKRKEREGEKRVLIFGDMLNKSRKYKYKWKKVEDIDTFFCFPKPVLSDYGLSATGLSVYPILCCKADFEKNKWFELSQSKIGQLAGISSNTVSRGIRELVQAGLVKRKMVMDGARQFYKYKVEFIRKPEIKEWEGQYFIFHTCIVESGAWANLKKPRDKVLYLGLRSEARFEMGIYKEIEDISQDDILEIKNNYSRRKGDFFNGSLSELCRMTNIERSNIHGVIEQLEEHGMIGKYGRYFMVYLKPEIIKLEGK